MAEDAGDGEHPVIVALPCFLPLGPGRTFTHPLSLAGGPSFREPFRLLEAWLTGIRYARNQANGHSVITAAPGLFHLPGLRVGDDNTPPFEAIESTLLARLPRTPVILSSTGDLSSQVNRRLTALAEQV